MKLIKIPILHFLITIQTVFSFASENPLSLPDPLTTSNGDKVTTPSEWMEVRRPELLELFRENVYGRMPVKRPDSLHFEVTHTDPNAMDGKATLKLVDISFSGPGGEKKFQLVLFIPNNEPKPVPGFVFINNRQRAHTNPSREKPSQFWPAEQMVERGYAAAAFHFADIAPDRPELLDRGVHGIFKSNEGEPAPDAWGAVAAWAWGASRVMDYLETDPDIDEGRIGLVGHSRAGKAALWCGAEDERFALVVSNDSGCTGASLARHPVGQPISHINDRFPHWFCLNYRKYNEKPEELPVDQHQLIALIAPRLVYVASASEDEWADPEGEFLSCVHAGPVYELFGLKGVGRNEFPEAGETLHEGHIGYHLRPGKHNLVEYDWQRFMDFADRHWKTQK